MKRPASVSKLVAVLADDIAERIEMRLGALDDSGAASHVLRQQLVGVLTGHIERVAAGIAAGHPDDSAPASKAH